MTTAFTFIYLTSVHLFSCILASNEFLDIINQPHFVDKSELVIDFLNNHNTPYFITSPRRFGKTINIHMLKTFFQAEVDSFGNMKNPAETKAYEIFKPLKISKHKTIISEHLARYPVLLLDLKLNISKNATNPQVETTVNNIIHRCFSEYTWIRNVDLDDISDCSTALSVDELFNRTLDENEMEYAILAFSRILQKHFKNPVIVFADDYDYAFSNLLCDFDYIHDQRSAIHYYYDVVNLLLDYTFTEHDDYTNFGYVTGVGGRLHSENYVNSQVHLRFLDDHPFTLYFGHTQSDLHALFDRYNCTDTEQTSVIKYYKGYTTRKGTILYNPYSISCYLQSKPLGAPGTIMGYWADEEYSEFIPLVLAVSSFRQRLAEIVHNQHAIEIPNTDVRFINAGQGTGSTLDLFYQNIQTWGLTVTEAKLDDLFRYFFDLGYLSFVAANDSRYHVPNDEINNVLKRKLLHFTETVDNARS